MTTRQALARWVCVLAAMATVVAGAAVAQAEAPHAGPAAPNLLKNPGFEQGADGWRLPKGLEVVRGAPSHGGDACLHDVRADAAEYLLASQPVPFQPGRRYRFSAWVRAKGVAGGGSGATLCMEWSGAKGWIGGDYPAGGKGDQDWFRVEGTTPPIPAEATTVAVTLYLRKGMTGEAWFDDVEVCESWGRPLEAYLLRPAYRGLIFRDEPPAPIRVRVQLADVIQGHARQPGGGYGGVSDLALVCRLYSGDRLVAEKSLGQPKDPATDVELDPARLAVGDYHVDVLLRQGDRDLASQRLDGRVLAAGERPRVCVDARRRTIVDGKPFFPLGFYLGTVKEEDVRTMAAAGFNCVMPYGFSSMNVEKAAELLDVARRHGVKVIYSVKDLYPGTPHCPKDIRDEAAADARVRSIVERFRSHPGVLAWYLNDELPPPMRDLLEARYRLVRRLDPDHPAWAVLFQVDQLADYRHTADVLGTDPYPVAARPVTMAEEWARKTRAATGGAGAVWQVPQAFAWSSAGRKSRDPATDRAPTYDEVRTMTYLALIEGATGLIYYSFYDLQKDPLGFDARWKDLARIGREVSDLAPALLATGPAPKVEVRGPRWAAFGDGARLWVLATNPDPQPVSMRLTLPARVRAVRTLAGRAVAAEGGVVTEEFRPLGCETYVAELP